MAPHVIAAAFSAIFGAAWQQFPGLRMVQHDKGQHLEAGELEILPSLLDEWGQGVMGRWQRQEAPGFGANRTEEARLPLQQVNLSTQVLALCFEIKMGNGAKAGTV